MFRTRSPGEVRGPSVGAGYSRGAPGRTSSVAPAAREGQLGHSWPLGWGGVELELGPWTGSLSPGPGPPHRAPALPKPLFLHSARCHFFPVKATAQAPPQVCPLVARAWLKSPSASLCIDLSRPTPVPPEPHPSPNGSVEPPPSFGWCRIANSVVRCAFPWGRVGGGLRAAVCP